MDLRFPWPSQVGIQIHLRSVALRTRLENLQRTVDGYRSTISTLNFLLHRAKQEPSFRSRYPSFVADAEGQIVFWTKLREAISDSLERLLYGVDHEGYLAYLIELEHRTDFAEVSTAGLVENGRKYATLIEENMPRVVWEGHVAGSSRDAWGFANALVRHGVGLVVEREKDKDEVGDEWGGVGQEKDKKDGANR